MEPVRVEATLNNWKLLNLVCYATGKHDEVCEGILMRLFGKLSILLLLGSPAMPVLASQWTDSEVKAMPPYCMARLDRDESMEAHWQSVLGPAYLHAHHYCYAIGFLNRYYKSRTTRDKSFNLQSAMTNMNYVIARVDSTFVLLPEIYMNRGLVQSLMKKDGAALTDFLKAIELDPGLARAYSMAGEIYVKLKKNDEALKLATEGLRHSPDSTVLKRLYLSLGGKEPYPEPAAKPQGESAAPSTESGGGESTASAPIEPVSPPQEGQATPPADQASRPPEASGATTPAEPAIGSPSNPWCRFCPPEPAK